MSLEHLNILINGLLNKDPDIVPEEAPLIILDRKSAKKGRDTNHTRHIPRRVHLARNGEKCKWHDIDWCEGILQL